MRGYFNVHGLLIELASEHPALFRSLADDLSHFRTSASPRRSLRLTLTALPHPWSGGPYPEPFLPHRDFHTQESKSTGATVTRYGTPLVTVLGSIRQPRILAGVVPDPDFLLDSGYHYCFTQPVSYWLKRRGLFFLHAGCVAEGTDGILIAGASRAGKSALSVSAVRSGFRFLGDEQPLLSLNRGTVTALAFPRRVRLDRSVARIFPELRRLSASHSSDRLIFSIEKVRPGSIGSSCMPRLLLFPAFRNRGGLRLRRLPGAAALARLLQDDHFVWYRNRGPDRLSRLHLSLFQRLVKQAPGFELEYGRQNILRIPDLFRELLAN